MFQLIHYGDLLAPTLTDDAAEFVSDPLPPLPLDYTELIWLVDMCVGGGSMLAFRRPGDNASARWCYSDDGFATFVRSLGGAVRLKHWRSFDAEGTAWFQALHASPECCPEKSRKAESVNKGPKRAVWNPDGRTLEGCERHDSADFSVCRAASHSRLVRR